MLKKRRGGGKQGGCEGTHRFSIIVRSLEAIERRLRGCGAWVRELGEGSVTTGGSLAEPAGPVLDWYAIVPGSIRRAVPCDDADDNEDDNEDEDEDRPAGCPLGIDTRPHLGAFVVLTTGSYALPRSALSIKD